MPGGELGDEVIHRRLLGGMLDGRLLALTSATMSGDNPALIGERRMREPFHLRAPLPPDDQDRELVELHGTDVSQRR